LGKVFGCDAIFGFGVGGFYEHTAKLLESLGVVNHFGGGFCDSVLRPTSVRVPLLRIFSVLMLQGFLGSCSQWFGFYMAEVNLEGKSAGHIVRMYSPNGGQSGYAAIEVPARYHIGTKIRSF